VCVDNNIEESPLIFNGSVVFTMSYLVAYGGNINEPY
jgi:hypothetical protein